MRFDRKTFFDGFRERLDEPLEQEQVDGLEFLLGRMESDPFWKHIPQIAYALATVFHETAGSFQPVVEGYYLAKTDPPDYAGKTKKVQAFQKKLRYYPYFGRGYVQLTWEDNYKKAGDALGMKLVKHPELALEPEGAYKTLTYGMHQGWFTGKKLDDYIKGAKKDYVNARKIINGTDKAGLIAGYARSFEKILKASAAVPIDQTATKTDPSDGNLDHDSNDAIASQSPQPNTSSDQAVEAKQTETTSKGGELEIQTKNEQSVTEVAKVTSPEPYMGVGFWGVIKRDLLAATGGNLSFSSLAEYAQQASGWPEWVVGMISKLAVGVLIATFGYFAFRVVHYVVDTWKKGQKTKTEAMVNTDVTRKDLEWVDAPPASSSVVPQDAR